MVGDPDRALPTTSVKAGVYVRGPEGLADVSVKVYTTVTAPVLGLRVEEAGGIWPPQRMKAVGGCIAQREALNRNNQKNSEHCRRCKCVEGRQHRWQYRFSAGALEESKVTGGTRLGKH